MFFSPFSIAITSLGEERANLSAFSMRVQFALVWFCLFPLPLGVWKRLRFVIVALPGLFLTFFTVYLILLQSRLYQPSSEITGWNFSRLAWEVPLVTYLRNFAAVCHLEIFSSSHLLSNLKTNFVKILRMDSSQPLDMFPQK